MVMQIGKHQFDTDSHTYIMGILNVTPDSFSDGGKYDHLDQALFHVQEMLDQGCDIVDIGGESTRPGHIQISEQEEADRVAPVIEAVRNRFDVPISVDTYKSFVAEAAVKAGADLVNDIWGLKYDPEMAGLIASTGTACCLMHNRNSAEYNHFTKDFLSDMQECMEIAERAGIAKDKIMLDPGVGFGKTYEQNLEIIDQMDILNKFGCPMLLGTSRKSVIGLTLELPTDQRLEGTLVTTVMAVMKGYSFVRVHDVEANKRAIRMTEAILASGRK